MISSPDLLHTFLSTPPFSWNAYRRALFIDATNSPFFDHAAPPKTPFNGPTSTTSRVATEIFLILEPAENPIHFPSGENQTLNTPSVPGNAVTRVSPIARRKRRGASVESRAANAMSFPS